MHAPNLALILFAGAVSAPSPAAVFRVLEAVPLLAARESAPQADEKKARKHTHANDFLIKGTVFDPQGLSLAGARLRVRRAGEKKFRWETHTDRRGEFAVRVPMGSDYELAVRARGFEEQTRAVDAKAGGQENVVFRMQSASGGKTK